MKHNTDGTPYSLEQITKILDQRFAKEEKPFLSDVFDASWAMGNQRGDYKAKAYAKAARKYQPAAK